VTSLPARVALVAVAALVLAWLGAGLRAVNLEQDGTRVADADTRNLSPEKVRAARDDLRDARWLNADPSPLLAESRLLAGAGRYREAAGLVRRAVDDEPENVDAWLVYYVVALASGDRAGQQQARREVKALNPYAADAIRRIDEQLG
jgi:hypothetical protein